MVRNPTGADRVPAPYPAGFLLRRIAPQAPLTCRSYSSAQTADVQNQMTIAPKR